MVKFDRRTAERGSRYVRDNRRAGGTRRRVGTPVAAGGGLIGIIVAVLGALLGFGAIGGGGSSSSFDIGAAGFDAEADASAVPDEVGTGQFVDPETEPRAYAQALMADIQDTWAAIFEQAGLSYTYTTLELFEGSVQTGCGNATSAVGPFYCPAPGDNQVYIDLGFYEELATRFGAPGDFAQAYVVAHEIGHHVQNVLGISTKVNQAQQSDPGNANEYSIRQELQADCFAGVWAHSASQRLTEESGEPIIEDGDIDEGLGAASAVGDDRIQSQAGMRINPETWTHGAAEQRARWFRQGFETGDPEQCDTFAAKDA